MENLLCAQVLYELTNILIQWNSCCYSYSVREVLEDLYLKESKVTELEVVWGSAGSSVSFTVVVPTPCTVFICKKLCVIYFQSSYYRLKIIHNRRESERKQSIFHSFLSVFAMLQDTSRYLNVTDTTNWKELELALEHGGCTLTKESFWLSIGPTFFSILHFL